MVRYFYNPKLDVIGEAVALYEQIECQELDYTSEYTISVLTNEPVGYVVFADTEDGLFISSDYFERVIKSGTIVELS